MCTEKKIQMNLAIPESYRNYLRRLAAERMMSDPSQDVTGSAIATELLLTALNEIGKFNHKEGENKNDNK